MTKTRKNRNRRGSGSATRGWKKQQPGTHNRTVMMRKCGKKCFLGPNQSFPICKKNTCTVSKKGVYAAYIRSRQYSRKNKSYRKIASHAKKMIK